MKIAGPIVGMVMAESALVGRMIVSKAVMSGGMSNLIFVVYSNALASLILLPISLFYHRAERPPLTFSLLCRFFVLGLVGCFSQVFGYVGINYSNPTLGTAMLNIIPAFTFVLAVVFRMERLDWRSASTLAKSIGTIVSVTGAFVITLYKGPVILMRSSSLNLHSQLLHVVKSNWVIGGLFLAAECALASAWIILQASILKKYPAVLIIVFFYCFFAAIQSAVISFIVEGTSSAWSLKSNQRLISVLYSGVFGSAFQVSVCAWCLYRTGPVFVSMFKPLGIAIAVAAGFIFFGDAFYLGSLVGSVIIIIGFYSVMWGKIKEEKIPVDTWVGVVESKSQKAPLLPSIMHEM